MFKHSMSDIAVLSRDRLAVTSIKVNSNNAESQNDNDIYRTGTKFCLKITDFQNGATT